MFAFFRAIKSDDRKFTFYSLWNTAILGKDVPVIGSKAEYATLVTDPDEGEYELEEVELRGVTPDSDQLPSSKRSRSPPKPVSFDEDHNVETVDWSPTSDTTTVPGRFHARHYSISSDETLHDVIPQSNGKNAWYRKVGTASFDTLERFLVFAGFVQLLTGIVVYTGGCRGTHINICLAHLIKGGIFWCYGLVTFARFLGSFSELGWAWNRIPVARRKNVPTAEFVESLVVFIYGITNTWMERFGAKPGDPYTTRQVQHISIAVSLPFSNSGPWLIRYPH